MFTLKKISISRQKGTFTTTWSRGCYTKRPFNYESDERRPLKFAYMGY